MFLSFNDCVSTFADNDLRIIQNYYSRAALLIIITILTFTLIIDSQSVSEYKTTCVCEDEFTCSVWTCFFHSSVDTKRKWNWMCCYWYWQKCELQFNVEILVLILEHVFEVNHNVTFCLAKLSCNTSYIVLHFRNIFQPASLWSFLKLYLFVCCL